MGLAGCNLVFNFIKSTKSEPPKTQHIYFTCFAVMVSYLFLDWLGFESFISFVKFYIVLQYAFVSYLYGLVISILK